MTLLVLGADVEADVNEAKAVLRMYDPDDDAVWELTIVGRLEPMTQRSPTSQVDRLLAADLREAFDRDRARRDPSGWYS